MSLLKFESKKRIDLSKFAFTNIYNNSITSDGNLEWRCNTYNSGWFYTPDIDWNSVQKSIELNCRCIPIYDNSEKNWNVIAYQIWNNTTAVDGLFPVIKPNRNISIATHDNVFIDYNTNLEYVDGQYVTWNLHKTNDTIKLKVFYDETLAFEHDFTSTEVTFPNRPTFINFGGVRFSVSGYGWSGTIDFKKTYVKLDDTLVWGIDS